MTNYHKSHWTPVEDKPVKKSKTAKEVSLDRAKLHGWTTPEQAVEMIDEMIAWLKAGSHPCPFKRL